MFIFREIKTHLVFLLFFLDDDLIPSSESTYSNRIPCEEEVPIENQNVSTDPCLTNYVPTPSAKDDIERLDAKILPAVKMHAYRK